MTNTQRHHGQSGDNDIILHKAQAEKPQSENERQMLNATGSKY